MVNPFFTNKEVTNFADAQTCDTKKFGVFFWELIRQGVSVPPSQFEAWVFNFSFVRKRFGKNEQGDSQSHEKGCCHARSGY